MTIEQQIINAALAAVKELYGQEVPEKMVQLQKTKKEFEGNLTLVVFPFLKISRKKPDETAREIGEYIKQNCEAIADFNAVGGFLNLVIDKKAWLALLNEMNQNEKFGEKPVTEASPLVMIEYSSPNTNKPLHLGHVRNNLLGWSLAQIMEANGNRVVKTNIVNDRGIHICKSMLAWLKFGNGETPETSGKKGDHLIGDYYVAFDQAGSCFNPEGSGCDDLSYVSSSAKVIATYPSSGYPGASGKNGVYYLGTSSYIQVRNIELPRGAKVFKISVGLHSVKNGSPVIAGKTFNIGILDERSKTSDYQNLDFSVKNYGNWAYATVA